MAKFDKYGDWAVVTGASSGIGKAISAELSEQGLKVVLVARTESDLRAVADELRTESKLIIADLTTTEGRQAVASETQDLEVGLFVHSAGLAHVGPFLSTPKNMNSDLLSIHCAATVELSSTFAERFRKRKSAGIILVSSGFGFAPIPFAAVYAAAKAFVISFGEALSEELRADAINVLTVIPGGTKTNMAAKLGELIDMSKLPMPMGEPETVARVALKALGKRDRVVPGFANKVMAKMMALMPVGFSKARMGKMLRDALITQPSK